MTTRVRRGSRHGEHVCGVYETQAEQLRDAAEYLAGGLRSGERAFYVADCDDTFGRLRAALADIGIEAHAFVERGALTECTHATAHLAGGAFDQRRMLALLRDEIASALDHGFAGLRACGDMSWLLADAPGADQVVEYEARLNGLVRGAPAAVMCQYDRSRLRAHWLDHALATHPSVVVDGRHKPNPFYVAPDLAVGRDAASADGVRVKLDELRRS